MAREVEAKERKQVRNPGLVFLTATEVDPKKFNEWFLRIQDFDYTDTLDDSDCVLVTSSELPGVFYEPTIPPLEVPTKNDFAGKSIDDIRDYVVKHEAQWKKLDIASHVWLIIDQEGLDNMTVVLAEYPCEDSDDGEYEEGSNEWRGVRLKCEEAWSAFLNLQIANLCFEEFVADEGRQVGRGMHEKLADGSEEIMVYEKLEVALKKLKEDGYI